MCEARVVSTSRGNSVTREQMLDSGYILLLSLIYQGFLLHYCIIAIAKNRNETKHESNTRWEKLGRQNNNHNIACLQNIKGKRFTQLKTSKKWKGNKQNDTNCVRLQQHTVIVVISIIYNHHHSTKRIQSRDETIYK